LSHYQAHVGCCCSCFDSSQNSTGCNKQRDFFLLLNNSQHHHQTSMLILEKRNKGNGASLCSCHFYVCMYDRSNTLPAELWWQNVVVAVWSYSNMKKLTDDNRRCVKIVQQMYICVEFSACVNTTTYLIHGH
jgi:hypothetical protein